MTMSHSLSKAPESLGSDRQSLGVLQKVFFSHRGVVQPWDNNSGAVSTRTQHVEVPLNFRSSADTPIDVKESTYVLPEATSVTKNSNNLTWLYHDDDLFQEQPYLVDTMSYEDDLPTSSAAPQASIFREKNSDKLSEQDRVEQRMALVENAIEYHRKNPYMTDQEENRLQYFFYCDHHCLPSSNMQCTADADADAVMSSPKQQQTLPEDALHFARCITDSGSSSQLHMTSDSFDKNQNDDAYANSAHADSVQQTLTKNDWTGLEDVTTFLLDSFAPTCFASDPSRRRKDWGVLQPYHTIRPSKYQKRTTKASKPPPPSLLRGSHF